MGSLGSDRVLRGREDTLCGGAVQSPDATTIGWLCRIFVRRLAHAVRCASRRGRPPCTLPAPLAGPGSVEWTMHERLRVVVCTENYRDGGGGQTTRHGWQAAIRDRLLPRPRHSRLPLPCGWSERHARSAEGGAHLILTHAAKALQYGLWFRCSFILSSHLTDLKLHLLSLWPSLQVGRAGLCSQLAVDTHIMPSPSGNANIDTLAQVLQQMARSVGCSDVRLTILEENSCHNHFQRALANAGTGSWLQKIPTLAGDT